MQLEYNEHSYEHIIIKKKKNSFQNIRCGLKMMILATRSGQKPAEPAKVGSVFSVINKNWSSSVEV